MLQLPLVISG